MRIELLILLALVLFSLFALSADSQSWADAARAERESWAAAHPSSANFVNTPIGSSPPSRDSSPHQAVNNTEDMTDVTNQSLVINDTIPKQNETTPVSGNWSLEISDDTAQNATLAIFQNGNTVFGKGHANVNNDTIIATACGSISDNELNIGLVMPEKIALYQLSMTVNGNSAIGSYTAFTTNGSTSSGTVKGVRSSPS